MIMNGDSPTILAERPVDLAGPNLPFAHLNLRHNPFGEIAPAERTDLAVADLHDVPRRLKSPREAVQFLGDCGRGKTTHLMALRTCFPDAPYVHLPEGEPTPPIPAGDGLLLIDELQRLPRAALRRLLDSGRPLAIGSHRDHRRALTRAGYRHQTIRPADRFNAERLVRIADRRIEGARRSPGPVPRLSASTARTLIGRFGCNVRAIEHELYERFQGLRKIGEL